MSTCTSFQEQVSSIMEVLTKTAIAEITKLVDDGSAALQLEMCRSQRENETLQRKLLLMERELMAVRGYGERALDNSLNISVEVRLSDEFGEAQRSNVNVAGKGSIPAIETVFAERLSADPARDDQRIPVEKKKVAPDALDIKSEPVDAEQDWPESLLPNEDRLGEDSESSQSQVEQDSEENTGGTLGATAANVGEGPHCEQGLLHMQPCPTGDPEKGLQAELKQEPEGQPLTHALPQLGSTEGLEIQCVWSEAKGSGTVLEKHGERSGSSEPGDARISDEFSPPRYRRSVRLRSRKKKGPSSRLEQQQNGRSCWLLKKISGGMYPLVFLGERVGSTPGEVSFVRTAEAKSRKKIKGRVESFRSRSGRRLPDTPVLRTHKERHGVGKRLSCSECDQTFIYPASLEKHRRIHNRQKPFACSWCEKCFSQLHVLQAHQSVHAGQKPYICAECGRRFRKKCYLKTHRLVHTREKRFFCKLCKKGFSSKTGLNSHQILHTGEKPHRCNECGKSFAHLCNLKVHRRIHTGETPFSCTLCSRTFSYISALKRHMLSDHKDKDVDDV